jgi:hypothetical protein
MPMTTAEVQVRMLWAWASTHVDARRTAMREQDPERGDGILQWVIMVALLAAAAITIVAIIVTKATDKANQTQTQ